MPAELSRRWVPTPKKTAKAIPTPASTNRERQLPVSPVASKLDTPKSQRKEKAIPRYTEAPDVEEQLEAREVPNSSPAPAKKSKKRKREKDAPKEEEEDETKMSKHRSILSKFEHSMKLSAQESANNQAKEASPEQTAQEELHDLIPLPQPAPVPDVAFEPTFSTLPKWLAEPITVDSTKSVPFASLGVHDAYLAKLRNQGYENALAVQSALLPMLHPGFEQHMGDICVSARTGSGKTLAYLLPIVEALQDRVVTTLSAIVVVPSRQLVDQAVKVAEELCVGTKLKVGAAQGSTTFASEQKMLVKTRQHYDPDRAKLLQEEKPQRIGTRATDRGSVFDDMATMPKNHLPKYESGVDILICTPGRLVEHIENTTGFGLRSVRWLVIDEADQLLTQNFQGWADTVIDALDSETCEDITSTREKIIQRRKKSVLSLALRKRRHVTKVILSATMKKDLTKLGSLRLRRPRLVVVEDEAEGVRQATSDSDVFELPSTLDEVTVSVADGSKKPLYLLYLLLNYILQTGPSKSESKSNSDADHESSSGSESDSSSQSDSSSNSPAAGSSIAKQQSRVLIFAKSNENANRLLQLLILLEPSLKPFINVMTRSATSKESRKMLQSFAQGKTKILVASDAASRGLDIPDITHVVNYDIPTSVESYVHRVGRTARAGKSGQAWTLLAKNEAAWFWNTIARGGSVKRGEKKVSRQELKERDVTWDRKRSYQQALLELQGAVEGDGEAGS